MTVPRSKIRVPRLPDTSVSRQRLLDLLPGGQNAAFALGGGQRLVFEVCAPAGYGKSTLLAAYAARLRDPGAAGRVGDCDRHDNDPGQLCDARLAWKAP